MCEPESIIYTCNTADSVTRVQWIATPVINSTGLVVTFDAGSPRSSDFVFDNIRVRQNPSDPSVTSMTIEGGLTRNVTVICLNRDDETENDTADYVSGGEYP